MRKNILVVGAGFAGACYAREIAEAGHTVAVIDRRPHIAGNAYDAVSPDGVRVHQYGPHLFHTDNEAVVKWVSRFGELTPYEHKVNAYLPPDRFVPLPVNRQTINTVFHLSLADDQAVADFLATQGEPIEDPKNAGEYLRSRIGPVLTDLFFRPYTKKMWDLDLEDLDTAVVKRLPLRFDTEDRYFPGDRFQFLPTLGYTALFERLLDHPGIEVTLGQEFDKTMLGEFDACFNSMAIDAYFDNAFGPLPYRSIRFHHRSQPSDGPARASVINFTDRGPYTRETDWSLLPDHRVHDTGRTTITREEPCDYIDNDLERFYPVKTSDGRYEAIYARYKRLAEEVGECQFIGRCGTYRYLDMHQVINQSLAGARRWLASVS